MNASHAIPSQITSVDFTFLTTAQIKTIAVKKLTTPQTFNTLLHPNSGGLHDLALGSHRNIPCKTCNLRQIDGCPGHCGYIELPTMVYHPSFIDQLLRLLRGKCVFCHYFRLGRARIHGFKCKLILLNKGLVNEALYMDHFVESRLQMKAMEGKKMEEESDRDEIDTGNDADLSATVAEQKKYVTKAMRKMRSGKKGGVPSNEAIGEARNMVIKEFMSEISKIATRCQTCNGNPPGFRKDRSVNMFMKYPTMKKYLDNQKRELKMSNPYLMLQREKKKNLERSNKPAPKHVDEGVADLDSGADEEQEAMVMELVEEDDVEEDMLYVKGADNMSATKETANNKVAKDKYLNPAEVHAAITFLFRKEGDLLRLIYSPRSKSSANSFSADMFFIDTILVPPSKFRPENPQGDSVTESDRNNLFKAIMTVNDQIRDVHGDISGLVIDTTRRRRDNNDLTTLYIELQETVNALIDKSSSKFSRGARQAEGVKQILEKKEGLFRMNMMGKRVNFAARSVISPDPNIESSEIGVPPVFAKKLTYPEPVNNHNIFDLKEAVKNGEAIWPGAVAVENEDGQILSLKGKSADQRIAIANTLLTPTSQTLNGAVGKKVHRHLANGDMVIMNRQPTLHKPSMMCHRVKVLQGEKTIRMHYANTKTYNADFDGDEMNMHFPQNELARAEASMIADTNRQFLSATAGEPLRGLIQDHITMGVHITNKDMFFDREDYQQLLYAGMRPEHGHIEYGKMLMLPPAIIKPKPLWTGKQVMSTILRNITPITQAPLSMDGKTTTGPDRWGETGQEDGKVIIRDGEVVTGIFDKKQVGGAFGSILHAIYETLGPNASGRFISILGRMLTKLLHIRAFSCGVEDLVLKPEGEKARKDILLEGTQLGLEAAAKYVSLEGQVTSPSDPELLKRLEEVLRDEEKHKNLDEVSKGAGLALSSRVTAALMPKNLIKPFPHNQMQTMTGSGAKGSAVNANLISCNLGQQVLEGRRVPVMVSGKSLPCFIPYDSSLRAGGFVRDRFLTGVKPQEYYFHTMAGREGLIDTAVKTSRSGYLQRCLVKGMEGLKVNYDSSVRDAADGSMIQFLYGEDGLDVIKASYLTQFSFTARNFLTMWTSLNAKTEYMRMHNEEAAEWNKKAAKEFTKRKLDSKRDPALSIYDPSRYAGSTSETFHLAVKNFLEENKDGLIIDKGAKQSYGSAVKKKAFQQLTELQYLKALAEPGEAVGIVAAQSIGEPSTQMTLNTFHLAGHSSKNVTLGIPRLREIVMTASAKIATPVMTMHLNPEIDLEEGARFAKAISLLSLAEVVDTTSVTQVVGRGEAYPHSKFYTIRFDFFPANEYCEEYNIQVRDVLDTIMKKCLPDLQRTIKTELKKKGNQSVGASDSAPDIAQGRGAVETAAAQAARRVDEDADSDDDVEEDDMDADTAKRINNKGDEKDENDAADDDELELASQASEELDDDYAAEDGPKETALKETTPEDDEDEDSNAETDDDPDAPIRSRPTKSTSDPKNAIHIPDDPEELLSRAQGYSDPNAISKFAFDPHGQWCTATLEYSASSPKLLMLQLVEKCTKRAVIQHIPGLKTCILDKDNKYADPVTGVVTAELAISTDGCNLLAVREFQDVINPHKIFTNDIAAMLRHYGVEAARASIVREMSAVFDGHGIDVNARHLNLIGDCMTRGGGYAAFNRMGIRNNTSAFMKMSFETTVGVLREAVALQEREALDNPSARLVVGRLSGVGTGSFDVLVPTAEQDREKEMGKENEKKGGEDGDVDMIDL